MHISQVQVDLGARSYPVLIGEGLLPELGSLLRARDFRQTQAFVITNTLVGGHYFATLEKSLAEKGFTRIVRHDLPPDEAGKNWEEFSRACAALLSHFPDTGSIPLVLLLGGGVVGDLGGFAAGVFRRGVPFVQIPSTLLAAVDSSVGGKVAVNLGGVKNIMGIFNQPRLVLCDLALLPTLNPREIRSGTSEIIKYGAICSEPLFTRLEAGDLERLLALDPAVLTEIVAHCVELKARVVEQDEFDQKGIRNVLNFGHTIGHALELSADYALTHGEAIAIGMVGAARLSTRLGVSVPEISRRLENLLQRAGLPISYPAPPGLFDRVLRAMQLDKKFREGRNLFVLPTQIGGWRQVENIAWDEVHAALRSVLI